jgi:hypothetical protein
MDEINVIFEGSLSIASKTQGKKLKREISLAQHIKSERRMKWSKIDISCGPEGHPKIELSNQNLSFMVKLSIGRHKVAKTLVDNGASVNLIMRITFIEMSLNLADLTPVHDTFHGVIPGQSSTPIARIDLDVSCGSGDNKHREMLTFKVTRFDIGYNCILGRSFLLKFMEVIHTAYATMKMPDLKGAITVKADQPDTLAVSATRKLKNRPPRRPRLRLVALLVKHRHPSHLPATPHGYHRHQMALILHQPLLQCPPIRRQIVR